MMFYYTQCAQCGTIRRSCNCETQEMTRRFEKADYKRKMQNMLESIQKALAQEASLKEIRRLARKDSFRERCGMSPLPEIRRGSTVIRFGRSSCPQKYSSYQGEF